MLPEVIEAEGDSVRATFGAGTVAKLQVRVRYVGFAADAALMTKISLP